MSNSFLKMISPKSKKSVDGVLAAFQVAIDDLDAVKASSTQEAEDLERDAIVAQVSARAARAEAQRAEEVSGKLRGLIAA